MRERLIGIDAGGTMTKAALFDLSGNELACRSSPNRMQFPRPGFTERDPDAMWAAACTAIRELLEITGTPPEDIAGVTPSGYGAGAYFVDRDLNPVRPGLVSTDTRTLDLIEAMRLTGEVAEIDRLIGARMFATHAIPLLRWFDDNEPDLFDRTHTVLFCKDFIRARLTGKVSTDPTDGGIAGIFDLVNHRYADQALHVGGVSRWLAKLPEVGPSVAVAGYVTEQAAEVTGLKAGTPVIRGVVDVTGSALASGVTDPNSISVVAGTFSINSIILDEPLTAPPPFIQSSFPIGNRFIATEGAATSASNVEWIFSTLLEAEGARARAMGSSIYEVGNRLVAEALDRDNDILFLPFLYGGPSHVPGGILGLCARHTLGDVLRVAFEGVVFAHKTDIDRLLPPEANRRPTVARMAGGASKSAQWCQMFADALDMRVEVADGSEFGAKAGAICAAVALGHHPDLGEAARRMVRVSRHYEPRLERNRAMARKLTAYKSVVENLAALH
ncbi:L-xylulokinase [Rhizobium sp. RU35A]|uniref:FGGY-family carbohydrate kinase n=1 Tax=Rhizobium sp. RU35A TaxID=1907414 RepID=UPI000953B0DB|nr:FGGY-family carbohydrate kinase [Rhizobium sp. RU35A]SIQ41609.1 L-xylulokinase [Rhizobium sp. RU35A]